MLTYTTTAANATEQYLQQYVMNYHSVSTDGWAIVSPTAVVDLNGDKPLAAIPGQTGQRENDTGSDRNPARCARARRSGTAAPVRACRTDGTGLDLA